MGKNTKIGCNLLAYFVICGFVILMHALFGSEIINFQKHIVSRLQINLELSQHSYKAIEHWTAVKQLVAAEKSKEEIEENYDKFWHDLNKTSTAYYFTVFYLNESSPADIIKKLKDTAPAPYQYNASGMTKEQTDQIDLLVAEFREKLSDEIKRTVGIANAMNRSLMSGRFLIMVTGATAVFFWIAGLVFFSWTFYRANVDTKTGQSQNEETNRSEK
jgi:predicted RND superfamily exporter protein